MFSEIGKSFQFSYNIFARLGILNIAPIRNRNIKYVERVDSFIAVGQSTFISIIFT